MSQSALADRSPESPPNPHPLPAGDRPGEPHTSPSTKRTISEAADSPIDSRQPKSRCIRDESYEEYPPESSSASTTEADHPTATSIDSGSESESESESASECESIFSQATDSTQSEPPQVLPWGAGWDIDWPETQLFVSMDPDEDLPDNFDFDTFLNVDYDATGVPEHRL